MNARKNFANTIKKLREEEGLTQSQVAEALGITFQAYQAYEYGRSFPSIENLIALADFYKMPLDEMIGRKIY